VPASRFLTVRAVRPPHPDGWGLHIVR
jgi:hypothetical protein